MASFIGHVGIRTRLYQHIQWNWPLDTSLIQNRVRLGPMSSNTGPIELMTYVNFWTRVTIQRVNALDLSLTQILKF